MRVKWTNLGFYLLATVTSLIAVSLASDLSLLILAGFAAWILFLIALFVEFEPKQPKQQRSTMFLKRCVNCNKEIPIASEECQYCGAKQPRAEFT